MDAPDRLTHVDESGAARMVDVSGKDVTARSSVGPTSELQRRKMWHSRSCGPASMRAKPHITA